MWSTNCSLELVDVIATGNSVSIIQLYVIHNWEVFVISVSQRGLIISTALRLSLFCLKNKNVEYPVSSIKEQ